MAAKMSHAASVFGLPPPPATYSTWMSASVEFKRTVAACLLDKYMEQAQAEAWEKLKIRLREEGEGVLKSILNGDRIFENEEN